MMHKLILLAALVILAQAQIKNTIDFTEANEKAVTNSLKSYVDLRVCSCDYYKQVCEKYCCCDPDCSTDIKDAWSAADACINTETTDLHLRCPNQDILQKLVDPNYKSDVKVSQATSVLCIKYDMTPFMGHFYTEIKTERKSDVNADNFLTTDQARKILIDIPERTAYTEGHKVWTTLSTRDSKIFPIPRPDPFGLCENTYSARFLYDEPLKTCHRKVDLATACAANTVLAYQTYTSLIKVRGYPSITSSNLITINVVNIVSSNGGAHADPTLSAACTCNNVVKYVEYEIVHDNAGIITAVNANLVLENVAFASCSSPVYIEQGFSVRYTTVSNAIPKSGSPGYVEGKPVLIGKLASPGNNAIERQIEGFYLTGINSAGECTTTSTAATEVYRPNTIINFNENTTVSCAYYVATETAFETLCTTDWNQLRIFSQFASATYFGRFGNSNIHYIKDWELLDTSQTSSASSSWDSGTKTCTQPTSEVINIFFAEYGPVNYPQKYIVKVLRTFETNEVKYATVQERGFVTYSRKVLFYNVTNIAAEKYASDNQ